MGAGSSAPGAPAAKDADGVTLGMVVSLYQGNWNITFLAPSEQLVTVDAATGVYVARHEPNVTWEFHRPPWSAGDLPLCSGRALAISPGGPGQEAFEVFLEDLPHPDEQPYTWSAPVLTLRTQGIDAGNGRELVPIYDGGGHLVTRYEGRRAPSPRRCASRTADGRTRIRLAAPVVSRTLGGDEAGRSSTPARRAARVPGVAVDVADDVGLRGRDRALFALILVGLVVEIRPGDCARAVARTGRVGINRRVLVGGSLVMVVAGRTYDLGPLLVSAPFPGSW